MSTTDKTIVIFRRWRDCGSVIALFPELPTDRNGHFCDAYEHVGQHGGADYFGVMQATTPVSIKEAASLKRELIRIGYRLVIRKRASRRMHEQCRATARSWGQ